MNLLSKVKSCFPNYSQRWLSDARVRFTVWNLRCTNDCFYNVFGLALRGKSLKFSSNYLSKNVHNEKFTMSHIVIMEEKMGRRRQHMGKLWEKHICNFYAVVVISPRILGPLIFICLFLITSLQNVPLVLFCEHIRFNLAFPTSFSKETFLQCFVLAVNLSNASDGRL